MYVQVAVELPARDNVLTVPQSAVTYSPYGDSLFVVGEDEDGAQIVRNTFVETGETRGDQVMIVSGVEAGATIVTAGQQKLRNGSRVQVDNSVSVSNQSAPVPVSN
jgi:membrane fusion protein (multidrug efflux system)